MCSTKERPKCQFLILKYPLPLKPPLREELAYISASRLECTKYYPICSLGYKLCSFHISVCLTTSGATPRIPCAFPFTFEGKTCAGPKCCNLNNAPGGSWCSTKNDENGENVKDHWGYCKGTTCDPGMVLWVRIIFWCSLFTPSEL